MRRRILCGLTVALAAICFGGVSTSVAQEVGYTKLSSFNALQTRLTEVEAQLASFGGGGGDCGCDGGCSNCTTPGYTVEAELLFLRAYSGGDFGHSRDEQWIATPRVTAGWVQGRRPWNPSSRLCVRLRADR